MFEFKNFKEFIQFFDDERICWDYLEKKRWNGNITCIYCECDKVYKYKNGKSYRCSCCKKYFSVTKGTIFERSKIPLTSWFAAIYLYTSHKTSVSSVQIAKHLGISQHTAWYMHHRIMEAFKVDFDEVTPVDGMWEVDEVYIGPNRRKISKARYAKMKNRGGIFTMQGIIGLLHRENGLVGKLLPDNSDINYIEALLRKHIGSMSVLMTDGWIQYAGMHKYVLSHEVFIHKDGEYGRGIYHTNTIEGAFRHFKDTIRGSFKQLGPKHLQRYWDEYCFRYNSRGLTDIESFDLTFKTINRRITYQELVHGQSKQTQEKGDTEGRKAFET